MTEDALSLKRGDVIPSRLKYAFLSPTGQRIPIFADDLHDWLNTFYAPGLNRSGKRAAYVRGEALHHMWRGGTVGHVPLKSGAWKIIQSDEAAVIIPQMHTQPLSKLQYGITPSGIVVARFPRKENTPAAVTFGDRNSSEGQTETPKKEYR